MTISWPLELLVQEPGPISLHKMTEPLTGHPGISEKGIPWGIKNVLPIWHNWGIWPELTRFHFFIGITRIGQRAIVNNTYSLHFFKAKNSFCS